MTTPASAHAPSHGAAIPNGFRDLSIDRVARHVLDEYFSDDERVAEYQAPGRRDERP